jgi:phosphoglycerate kinase
VAKRSVSNYPVQGKRVLMRVDFNVPLKDGSVADDTRIRAALPTITYLLERDCPVILASHLGRPKGQVVEELRLAPVAKRLAELLGCEVRTVSDCVGPEVEAAAAELPPGDVLLLENLRFHKEETDNDPEFARRLAGLANVYVNDAFGAAHRAHASTEGVAHHLPAVAGFLMAKELEILGRLLAEPARPFVVVLGGVKVSDKIGVIESMLAKADSVLIGGAMCFTFFKEQGREVGASLVEADKLDVARQALDAAASSACEFLLPADVVVAPEPVAGASKETVAADGMPGDRMGLDIGRQTIAAYRERIAAAGTVFWNGPMGLFEIADFADGTRAVAEAVASCPGITVTGGGDTVSALRAFGLERSITHVSTGGGASMEFLEGRPLPGVEALLDARE